MNHLGARVEIGIARPRTVWPVDAAGADTGSAVCGMRTEVPRLTWGTVIAPCAGAPAQAAMAPVSTRAPSQAPRA